MSLLEARSIIQYRAQLCSSSSSPSDKGCGEAGGLRELQSASEEEAEVSPGKLDLPE